jgi:hypothetical protein
MRNVLIALLLVSCGPTDPLPPHDAGVDADVHPPDPAARCAAWYAHARAGGAWCPGDAGLVLVQPERVHTCERCYLVVCDADYVPAYMQMECSDVTP